MQHRCPSRTSPKPLRVQGRWTGRADAPAGVAVEQAQQHGERDRIRVGPGHRLSTANLLAEGYASAPAVRLLGGVPLPRA